MATEGWCVGAKLTHPYICKTVSTSALSPFLGLGILVVVLAVRNCGGLSAGFAKPQILVHAGTKRIASLVEVGSLLWHTRTCVASPPSDAHSQSRRVILLGLLAQMWRSGVDKGVFADAPPIASAKLLPR